MSATDAYSSHSSNWPLVGLTLVLAAPLAVLSRPADGTYTFGRWAPSLLFLLVVVVLSVLTATSLRVTAGRGGVTARFGILPIPTFHYPVARIDCAEAATIRPWATPGIYWTRRDGWRLALRSGPAIRLTLTSGRLVTVGVDDPAAALRALQVAGVADTHG